MRIGPYEILSEVGQGGCAVVFRGRSKDGRDVAVKLFRGNAPDELARFLREQKLHAQLGPREGFVPLVASGTSPEGPYIVMPYMRGGTLRDRLELPAVVDLGVTLATALGRAHERAIVHRDLKPENVLYSSDGRPFIADLGLAKHFRRPDGTAGVPDAKRAATVTQVGEYHGTVGYMAPEQVGDSPWIGPPADVFALGAILYECIAGRPAFAGATVFSVIKTLAIGGIEALARIRPDVPPRLATAVHRALQRYPQDRFADGHALAKALAP